MKYVLWDLAFIGGALALLVYAYLSAVRGVTKKTQDATELLRSIAGEHRGLNMAVTSQYLEGLATAIENREKGVEDAYCEYCRTVVFQVAGECPACGGRTLTVAERRQQVADQRAIDLVTGSIDEGTQ